MEKRSSHHQFITAGGTLTKPKYTTRHLSALHFLLNIPMEKEIAIVQAGIANASKIRSLEDGSESDGHSTEVSENNNNDNLFPTDDLLGINTDLAGKKLKGPSAPTLKVPMVFRYQQNKVTDQSAMVRQWEDQMLSGTTVTNSNGIPQQLLSFRLFFTKARGYPSMVCSIIKYDAGEEKAKMEKIKAVDQKGLEVYKLPIRDWRGCSYKTYPITDERFTDSNYGVKGYLYDPNYIDDPELLHGSHRYVLQRSASTGPILSSIILFVNKKELENSLNEQFRESHPNLPPSLTLSRIRNIKKITLLYCVKIGIEVSTVALAVINFERLCMKGFVTKVNLELSMAISLLLAFKFCETVSIEFQKRFDELMNFFDQEWDLSQKQVLEAEFGAFVNLGFSLHIPSSHIYLVYVRLLKLLNLSSRNYLGEEMNNLYVNDILELNRWIEYDRIMQKEKTKEKEKEKYEREKEKEKEELLKQQLQHHEQIFIATENSNNNNSNGFIDNDVNTPTSFSDEKDSKSNCISVENSSKVRSVTDSSTYTQVGNSDDTTPISTSDSVYHRPSFYKQNSKKTKSNSGIGSKLFKFPTRFISSSLQGNSENTPNSKENSGIYSEEASVLVDESLHNVSITSAENGDTSASIDACDSNRKGNEPSEEAKLLPTG